VPGSAGAADAPAAGAADDEAAEDEEEQEEEAASDRAGISAGDSSRNGSSDSSGGGGNSTAAGGASVAPKAKRLPNAEVLLSHLRSYEGMGVAQVRPGQVACRCLLFHARQGCIASAHFLCANR
jgi:hypothetical protein